MDFQALKIQSYVKQIPLPSQIPEDTGGDQVTLAQLITPNCYNRHSNNLGIQQSGQLTVADIGQVQK